MTEDLHLYRVWALIPSEKDMQVTEIKALSEDVARKTCEFARIPNAHIFQIELINGSDSSGMQIIEQPPLKPPPSKISKTNLPYDT